MTETGKELERLRLMVRLATIQMHNANAAYTVHYDDCENDGYGVATDLDNAVSEVEHLLLKVGKERDQALSANAEMWKLLGEVLTNGLIYWEPNTARGHERKTDMVERIQNALSALPTGTPATPKPSGNNGLSDTEAWMKRNAQSAPGEAPTPVKPEGEAS